MLRWYAHKSGDLSFEKELIRISKANSFALYPYTLYIKHESSLKSLRFSKLFSQNLKFMIIISFYQAKFVYPNKKNRNLNEQEQKAEHNLIDFYALVFFIPSSSFQCPSAASSEEELQSAITIQPCFAVLK